MAEDSKNAERFEAWRSSSKSPKWIADGLAIALEFSKAGQCKFAADIYDLILAYRPVHPKACNGRLFNMYRQHVRVFGRDKDVELMRETAETIVAECTQVDKYTPYTYTVLRMAQEALGREDSDDYADVDSAAEWLKRLDPGLLENRPLATDTGYWSQLRKYYELLARVCQLQDRHQEAVEVLLLKLRECKHTEQEKDGVKTKLRDLARTIYLPHDGDVLNALLAVRGFTNQQVRDRYHQAAMQRYLRRNADDDTQSTQKAQDRFSDALIQELFSLDYAQFEKRSIRNGRIRATDIAAFAFCPASFSIASTYEQAKVEKLDWGTRLHGQQRLISEQKESFRTGWFGYISGGRRDPLQAATRHAPPFQDFCRDPHEAIGDLLQDISGAQLIVSGHNSEDPVVFTSGDGRISGSPDYVFKKGSQCRFAVEEKFTLYKEGWRPERAFPSHVAQLGVYITQLKELDLSYGYILYWLCKTEYPDPDFGETSWQVVDAVAFKVNRTPELSNSVRKLADGVASLTRDGSMAFSNSMLDPRKCLGCSTALFCQHRTGTIGDLSFPYAHFKAKHISDGTEMPQSASGGLTFAEACKIAKGKGGRVVRDVSGSGFIVK